MMLWWLGVTSSGMGPVLIGHLNVVGIKDRMGTHPIGLIIANLICEDRQFEFENREVKVTK
jgi:hypothetical protein